MVCCVVVRLDRNGLSSGSKICWSIEQERFHALQETGMALSTLQERARVAIHGIQGFKGWVYVQELW